MEFVRSKRGYTHIECSNNKKRKRTSVQNIECQRPTACKERREMTTINKTKIETHSPAKGYSVIETHNQPITSATTTSMTKKKREKNFITTHARSIALTSKSLPIESIQCLESAYKTCLYHSVIDVFLTLYCLNIINYPKTWLVRCRSISLGRSVSFVLVKFNLSWI